MRRAEDMAEKMRKKAQGDIVSDLAQKKHVNNDKRIESSSYDVAIQALSEIGKTVSKSALWQAVSRECRRKYGSLSQPVSAVTLSSPSSLSTLTPPNDDDNAAGSNGDDRGLAAAALTAAAAALDKDRGLAAAALTSAAAALTSAASALMSPNDNDNAAGSNEEDRGSAAVKMPRAGRPKGTTNDEKTERKRKYHECVERITFDYATTLTEARLSEDGATKLDSGYLANLIEVRKAEYEVEDSIPKSTIRTRFKRGNHNPKHRGTRSPLADAEALLVTISIQMGIIRQPLNVTEGIQCMNDLIKGTDHAEALAEFQRARKLCSKDFEHGTVTQGW